MRLRISGVAAILALSVAAPALGDMLLDEARRRAETTWRWEDRRQTLTLTIDHGRGATRTRKLVMLTKREAGEGERSLAVFLEPAEVRGTAFLQHVPGDAPSLQWLYLPGDGRPRRVASSARRQSFFGTDFSYADLDILENVLRWTPEQAEARAIDAPAGEESAGRAWFELRQRASERAYERIAVALSENDVLLRRMLLFDAGEAPTKRLHFEEIRNVGEIPTAFRLVLEQPRRRTRTTVDISDVEYDTGLPDRAFSTGALPRGLDLVR